MRVLIREGKEPHDFFPSQTTLGTMMVVMWVLKNLRKEVNEKNTEYNQSELCSEEKKKNLLPMGTLLVTDNHNP